MYEFGLGSYYFKDDSGNYYEYLSGGLKKHITKNLARKYDKYAYGHYEYEKEKEKTATVRAGLKTVLLDDSAWMFKGGSRFNNSKSKRRVQL